MSCVHCLDFDDVSGLAYVLVPRYLADRIFRYPLDVVKTRVLEFRLLETLIMVLRHHVKDNYRQARALQRKATTAC